MANVFKQSSEGLSAFDQSSELLTSLDDLRSTEQELCSRLAHQESEIQRMQNMLDSVEEIRSETDHLRTDHPHVIPFTQCEANAPKEMDSNLWTRLMRSPEEESETIACEIRLGSQMTTLEEELAAGETELQMAQKNLQALIRSKKQRQEKIESLSEANAADIDDLQHAKTELQEQLQAAGCEVTQLRQRISSLESTQVEQDDVCLLYTSDAADE